MMMFQKRIIRKTDAKGFTLIELLIVMAIIAMLAAIVGPSIFNKLVGAKRDGAAAQISTLDTAIAGYRLDVGKYPNSLEGLIKNDTGSSRWRSKYLNKSHVPKDPWGNDYHYQAPGSHDNDYDLYSYGPDNQEGGEGDDADIVNW